MEAAAAAIDSCDFLLIGAGAGASAESGLLTFAQVSALKGLKDRGLTYDQAAGLESFARRPEVFQGFFARARASYQAAEPHAGYDVLKRWASKPGRDSIVVTSNIDGFFERVGFDCPVAQVHGNVFQYQCGGLPSGKRWPMFERERCCDRLFPAPDVALADGDESVEAVGEPPACPFCGAHARPNVYLFGDGSHFVADPDVVRADEFFEWRHRVLRALQDDPTKRLAVVEVGCGLRVPSIRKRCELLVGEAPPGQALLVRVNPAPDSTWVGGKQVPCTRVATGAVEGLAALDTLPPGDVAT